MMLERIPGLTVIGESPGNSGCIKEPAFHPADLVFLDVHLRNVNAFELTRSLHTIFPAMKIVILTMFSEPDYVTKGIKAGANAVLLKSFVGSTLLTLLQELFPGEFNPGASRFPLNDKNG